MSKLLFIGPVQTASGYGVHARQLLQALVDDGRYEIHLESIKWGDTSFLTGETPLLKLMPDLIAARERGRRDNVKYDISVQVTIPNEFKRCASFNVGVTAGIETDAVSPQWLVKANEDVDLLIVPSYHAKAGFDVKYNGSDGSILQLNKPAVPIPEGFDPSVFNVAPSQCDSPLEPTASFNFLHVGLGLDKALGEDRKNISSLVKWFCETFKGNEDVGLILKCGLVNNSLADFEALKVRVKELKKLASCDRFPTVDVVHGRLTDAQMAALYKHPKVKAFISLTHGEGYGLPMLEAAACGLPVIATAWSGHLDFLTKSGTRLFVPIENVLEPIPDSAVWDGVMERGTKWANVSEADVKQKMLKVVAKYDKPKQWAAELASHVAENYSTSRTNATFSAIVGAAYTQWLTRRGWTSNDDIPAVKRNLGIEPGQKTLLYTMPMSAGDVFLSTGIVSALAKKFPEHKIFFATQAKYASILQELPFIDAVIEWQQWMLDIGACEDMFDEVFTPNINIQMSFSNWVHRGEGRNILEEMGSACMVETHSPRCVPTVCQAKASFGKDYIVFHPGSGKGQWEARNYRGWQDIIDSLRKALPHLTILQVGTSDEPLYKNVLDARGLTKDYRELFDVISGAACMFGIDSVVMHMAAALDIDVVAAFGSSYAKSTGPLYSYPPPAAKKHAMQILVETDDRMGCDRACYRYQCKVDRENPCINNIPPEMLFRFIVGLFDVAPEDFEFREHRPTISGYTHLLNAVDAGLPYEQSIESMLGFCDQVVVIDGGSTDGTKEHIVEMASKDGRILLVDHKWDPGEPGMDGLQKATGRACCVGDFLWQQDADEVVHPDDYEKIRKIVKRFPADLSLLHLPVIELWGDRSTVRTDRHSWKWRLSRNDFRITHGIVKHARVMDKESGKTYAKKGQSDGCEYIDVMTGEYIQHKGFYNDDLEKLRRTSPAEYGKQMNKLFDELPSVFHFSWADLPRKVRHFKKFWNACWQQLYKDAVAEDRFPDVIDELGIAVKAKELLRQGGEHARAETFKLVRQIPASMDLWFTEREFQNGDLYVDNDFL